jgi:uncharacterized membrane protein
MIFFYMSNVRNQILFIVRNYFSTSLIYLTSFMLYLKWCYLFLFFFINQFLVTDLRKKEKKRPLIKRVYEKNVKKSFFILLTW